MALDCNREAFKPGEGCPQIEADLSFPDFESCEAADVGKLKSPSRLDLQKHPAIPMFIPANDPLPVPIPDIEIPEVDFVIECPFDSVNEANISFSGDSVPGASGKIVFDTDGTTCRLSGIRMSMSIPSLAAFVGTRTDAVRLGYTVEDPFHAAENDLPCTFVPILSGSHAYVAV